MNLTRTLVRGAKGLLRLLLGTVLAVLAYGLLSLLLGAIPVNPRGPAPNAEHTLYLSTNGLHLDLVMPTALVPESLGAHLRYEAHEAYLAFGWGDEGFYLRTPEWSDLSAGTALSAVFLPTPSLIHLTRYSQVQPHWVPVRVSDEQLAALLSELASYFALDAQGRPVLLPGAGYSSVDDFYRARGSYWFGFTCNTWANRVFRRSGLRACLWTPWDFALLNKHRP